ncbi:T9SS type B sorting domain-containing protein [Flavobacterium sp. P7388]|uniref:T9SS type B sorting domain-containing protein n=2 Tax=Flavobacterium geliluteum TaxID=2816120 RepID=A0A941AX01_9FLAO|nr:T9SS type B sorting domain-containing protein [Flavobacterium geliluteum]
MNCFKITLIGLFMSFFSIKMIGQQVISIDDTKTPEQLINTILVNNTCVSVSNINGFGDTFTPGQKSFAYFNKGASNFPFSEGVVLATSPSHDAIGPFRTNRGGGNPNWQGDSDLNQALGINSVNATVLEFDFIPLTDFLSFNYIFASNEYQSFFPCQYSDGFAFLIKEADDPTAVYKNLAVLPNQTAIVSSTNVRPKIEPGFSLNGNVPYQGCPEQNQEYFNGINTAASPINYAGQTVVMNAQSPVISGKKYHIKLVIADDSEEYYDSAVFIEAGSFKSKIDFGPDRTIANNSPICFGETTTLNTNLSATYTYRWYKNNILIPAATNPYYSPTDSGTYKAEVVLTPSTCTLIGEIKIDFSSQISVSNATMIQCGVNNNDEAIFNLSKLDNIIKNDAPDIVNAGYYETLADAQAKTNTIISPENYTSRDKIIFARIENKYGCYATAEITLRIVNNTIPNQNPFQTCDQDPVQDGLYQFDLNAEISPNITGVPAGLRFVYYLNTSDALTEKNPLPNIFKNTTPNSQIIYARAINGSDCYDIIPIQLEINTFDPPNFGDETIHLCKGDSVDLTIASGFASYRWDTGVNNSNTITATTAGDYIVTVTDIKGCEKAKKFTVDLSEPATLTNTQVKEFSGNDNSVLLEFTGSGDYEFSLDGITFQNEPLFASVLPGIYNAVARKKKGCGMSNTLLIYVVDYPRFFTPNGDGFNDIWQIKNASYLPDFEISIFDRYGKLVKQMNQQSSGWSGLFNNQQLPADDYWFTLLFADGKNVKGHFSLKR